MSTEEPDTPVPPAEVEEEAEIEEPTEQKEDDDWDEVPPPPEEEDDDVIPSPPEVEDGEEKVDEEPPSEVVEPEEEKVVELEQPYRERAPPVIANDEEPEEPDFSKYKTNVSERLYRAQKVAEKAGITASPDIVNHTLQYQQWRKKMGFLYEYLEEYQDAMKLVSEKRDKVIKQFALLSGQTPLWDQIGKPLEEEKIAEIEATGDLSTLEGVEERTKMIMKVAEDIGPGTLMAHHQLSVMQDELNNIDYKNHIVNYIDEWEDVVTSKLDKDVKAVREAAKVRDHYIEKVDKLTEQRNKIEHRGKQSAPKKLLDHLERNEKKLIDADAVYEKKANEVSVVLFEATQRGWVDLYPVMKNVMKFEINRLGRESSTYGSMHGTLASLKASYKEATKNTADEPNTGSAL